MAHAVGRTSRGLLVAFILLFSAVSARAAQETGQIGRLYITESNTESFPGVQLQTYGMDGQGNPIDFATEPLFLSHNNFPVTRLSSTARFRSAR